MINGKTDYVISLITQKKLIEHYFKGVEVNELSSSFGIKESEIMSILRNNKVVVLDSQKQTKRR